MPIKAERGFLIPAIGEPYEACAEKLRNSLLHWYPSADVTIMTEEMLPFGKLPGFSNDWQCWYVSPYRETIKLEADMLVTSPIEHWWNMLRHKDVVISTGCKDFYGMQSDVRYYRKIFDINHLPDVYNAITYWRLSNTAKEFWEIVRQIFTDWKTFSKLIKFPEQEPSTDLVYAMAATIVGVEKVTLPSTTYPMITHMKKFINPLKSSDWTKELVWEKNNHEVTINTIKQQGMLHYHIKDWLNG